MDKNTPVNQIGKKTSEVDQFSI